MAGASSHDCWPSALASGRSQAGRSQSAVSFRFSKWISGSYRSRSSATRSTLQHWIDQLRSEAIKNFPEKVTAFRKDMAVHGRYGQPCPRCGDPIQRIRYADNETNYCAGCQTGGRVLADRSLSRLLGEDWPRTLDDLEALKRR